jgi:hypothetical protein
MSAQDTDDALRQGFFKNFGNMTEDQKTLEARRYAGLRVGRYKSESEENPGKESTDDDNMLGHQRTFDGLEQLNRRIAEAAGSPEGYGKDDATKQNTDAVNKNTEALNKKTETAASQRPGGLR